MMMGVEEVDENEHGMGDGEKQVTKERKQSWREGKRWCWREARADGGRQERKKKAKRESEILSWWTERK